MMRFWIPLLCLLVGVPLDAQQEKIFGRAARRPGSTILPEDRLGDWKLAGVPGGIPKRTILIDVTKPPFNADPTGAADAQPAIAQAIAKAAENEVVHLPAGTYRMNTGLGTGGKSRITLRGDGPDKTILRLQTGGISVGTGGGDWWYPNRMKVDLLADARKGANFLAVDPKGLEVGRLCQVSLKNDPRLPVIVPGAFEYMRSQITRIVGKREGGILISPPLQFDLPMSLEPRLRPTARTVEFVGVEDLTIDGAAGNVQVGLGLSTAYGCWVRNVAVRNITNYHLSIGDSLQCEIRHSTIATRKGAGSNGAGFLVGMTCSSLFEDNILIEQFPHIEVNASTGNVFGYNYCHDSTIQGVVGCSINSNHGAHSSFNLYEGNISPKFQADGYHGSSSHDTIFRNWLHGSSDKTPLFWICVNLNRFTRNYSVVGNVLGRKGHPWIYDNDNKGYGYDQHLIYSLGMPNMGNGGFNGVAQPSKGKPWADWAGILAGGKGPGPGGFQELDLDVRATTLLKGNYNYKHEAVPPNEALNGGGLPKSLYLTEKPAWFGSHAWPAFGPDTAFESNQIPAQARFEAMKGKN
jgi:hypothetical protein